MCVLSIPNSLTALFFICQRNKNYFIISWNGFMYTNICSFRTPVEACQNKLLVSLYFHLFGIKDALTLYLWTLKYVRNSCSCRVILSSTSNRNKRTNHNSNYSAFVQIDF
jgi:hypothetical protein